MFIAIDIFMKLLKNEFVFHLVKFYTSIFDIVWMKERLLRGDHIGLKYMRYNSSESGYSTHVSANLETIIGDIHDITRDLQRNHMFIYSTENELVFKQLSKNINGYEHEFKAIC